MKIFKWELPFDCAVEFHVNDDHTTKVIMRDPNEDDVVAEFDTYSESIVSICSQLLTAYRILTNKSGEAVVHVCGGDLH